MSRESIDIDLSDPLTCLSDRSTRPQRRRRHASPYLADRVPAISRAGLSRHRCGDDRARSQRQPRKSVSLLREQGRSATGGPRLCFGLSRPRRDGPGRAGNDRSGRACFCPVTELPTAYGARELPARLPNRQPGARGKRRQSGSSRAPAQEFRKLDGASGAVVDRSRRPVAARRRSSSATSRS